MVQQAPARIDRPAPDHYQVRLSGVLSLLPVQQPAPPRHSPMAPRRLRWQPRRRRTGQLALPLEVR